MPRVPRPYVMIRTDKQWQMAAFERAALLDGAVQLAWYADDQLDTDEAPEGLPAGLAFDSYCRLYHSVPEEGRIERLLWQARDPLTAGAPQQEPVDLFAAPDNVDAGDFVTAAYAGSTLKSPRGLAVDQDNRLFVCDAGARRVYVYDLWRRRLLRSIKTPGRPVDAVANERNVWVLLEGPASLIRLTARSSPREVLLPAGLNGPSRIAISPGRELYLLDGEQIVNISVAGAPIEVPGATDIEFQTGHEPVLVVARTRGADFLRFDIRVHSVENIAPLKARNYDGRGVVRTPDNRIGFWTPLGFRHAVRARVRYQRHGRVTTFRLDSGSFNTNWGRIFLDACVPRETTLRVFAVAVDEPPEEPQVPRTPPANMTSVVLPPPESLPPMPPVSLRARPDDVEKPVTGAIAPHQRETGSEIPWLQKAANDSFETYEIPAHTAPGRYLWITLELAGDSRHTPRVRALRAEYPAHDLLRRLPKIYSRDAASATFLHRFLSLTDGLITELDGESEQRHILLNPMAAPAEILPWLASFVGLVTSEQWPVSVRRELIRQAIWLFRFRGTVIGLRRFLEIYTGTRVILLEKFRFRGLGGAVIGDETSLNSTSVLGAGFRVGGAIGETVEQSLNGTVDDAYKTHAHRFAVVIPAKLSSEQQDAVRHILEVHRPAHTLFEICTVDAGMRVGRGLLVELTSIIGRSGSFAPLQTGGSVIGRGGIIGEPQAGTNIGGGVVGRDTRVG